MTTTYKPRANVARILRWLIDQGEGAEVTSTELATVLDIDPKQVIGYLMAAIDAGVVRRVMKDGRNVWSIANRDRLILSDEPAPAEKEPEPEEVDLFDAALWANGCLILEGVEFIPGTNQVALQPEQAAKVKRLLNGEAV